MAVIESLPLPTAKKTDADHSLYRSYFTSPRNQTSTPGGDTRSHIDDRSAERFDTAIKITLYRDLGVV